MVEKLGHCITLGVSTFLVLVSAFSIGVLTSPAVLEGASPLPILFTYGGLSLLICGYIIYSSFKKVRVTFIFSIVSIALYILAYIIF